MFRAFGHWTLLLTNVSREVSGDVSGEVSGLWSGEEPGEDNLRIVQETTRKENITFLLLLVCVATWSDFSVLQRGPKQRGPLRAAAAAADGDDGDHWTQDEVSS